MASELRGQLQKAFKEWVDLRFPMLGYSITHFVLYDSTLAGLVDSYLHRTKLEPSSIPYRDSGMEAEIEQHLSRHDDPEVEHLRAYVQAMDRALDLLQRCIREDSQ